MFLACNTKLCSLVALLLITVVLSCCKENSVSQKNIRFTYAEVQAHVVEVGRESFISRKMYISPDGKKVVFSEIRSETGFSDYKTTTSRFLSEFLKSDSIFMYDSGDSTCIALAVSDLAQTGINAFPFSAKWLLFYSVNASNSINTDTLTIAGCLSRKDVVANGYIWICGQQPVAIETNIGGTIHSERITKYKPDTILSESIFRQPLGFRRILPST